MMESRMALHLTRAVQNPSGIIRSGWQESVSWRLRLGTISPREKPLLVITIHSDPAELAALCTGDDDASRLRGLVLQRLL